ncbi:hypothetical protein [Halothermothrix orenii]|uniref:Lipoprotein n=1 Tax=Halothermothrix orenii (strain H 168 / OCM 544 / DSM 9562) TaxID=373903 RepID=B8CXX1_HALOH|nr:hypothetical protein [Halothermothrix orenii]ACL70140.1 hypothetical protein Hore_13900 [Halothermothrix orenii H 168]
MRKKVIIIFMLAVLLLGLVGCESGSNYVYNIQMIDPEPDGEPLTYRDNTLAIKFTPLVISTTPLLPPDLKGIKIRVTNLSDSTIKILWDDMSFIDIDNSVTKIMHQGVKYANRNESMAPTSIPAGTILEDTIVPTDRISWSNISNSWVNAGIVNQYNATQYHQEEIGITLPVEYKGEVKEYIFKFKVTAKKNVSKAP